MKRIGIVKTWLAKYKANILLNRLVTVLGIDMLVKVSGFLLLPVYLRLMTQDEFGLYSYLLSIILTFSVILNFGLYIPLTKFYQDDHHQEKRGELLFTVAGLLIILLFIIIVPSYIFGLDFALIRLLFKNQIQYESYRWVVLLAVIMTVFNFMLTTYFFATEKLRILKNYSISRIIVTNAGVLGFLVLFRNADSVRIRFMSTYILELILFCVFSYYFINEMQFKFDKKVARSGLKLSLPVMASAIFGIGINFSDKFFLEKYSSFEDLSHYYLAVSFASIIPLVFTSLQNAWLPLFLREKDIKKNIATTNKLIRRVSIGFVVLSAAMIIFLVLLVQFDIVPQKYRKAIYVLPILLIAQIISSIVTLHTNYLIYYEKTHWASVTGFILCLVSVGLSLLLIPSFNVYGAGTVLVISNVIYLFLYYFIIKTYTKKYLKFKTEP